MVPPNSTSNLEMLHEVVGHPERDREYLRAASLVFHADKIRAPPLIAQGVGARRADDAESDQMEAALWARWVHVPYLVKDDEGNGVGDQEGPFEFCCAVERFLVERL